MSNKSNGSPGGGSLGLFSCVSILLGGMIGSAIFSISGLTIWHAGAAALLTWIIAAAIQMMYGLQIAELSVLFPRSGGVFVFPAKSLGRTERQGKIWGFISVWGYIGANIIAIAFAAIHIATYLGGGFPALGEYQIPLAVAACVITGILNLLGTKITNRANAVLVAGLVGTMLIFICAGIFSGKWSASLMTPFFTQGVGGTTGFITAVPNAMMAYGSIVAIAFLVGEVKNPNKNVPKSMAISMGIAAALYLLVLATIMGLQNTQFFIDNPGMRFIPLSAVALTQMQHLTWLPKVISISALLALVTTMIIVMALTTRAIVATAEGGFLPKFLANSNKSLKAPIHATLVITVASMVISCLPQFTFLIVNIGALFAVITISINCISLIAARKKQTYIPGQYRAPGGYFLPIATIALIVAAYIPGLINSFALWAYIISWYAIGALVLITGFHRINKIALKDKKESADSTKGEQ